MLLPAIIVLFAINVLPILDTIKTSLDDYYIPMPNKRHFVGLENYISLLRDTRFLLAFLRTLIFITVALVMEIMIGLALALYLAAKIRSTKILRSLFLLPNILTPIATAFMWRIMFSPTLGILNYFLSFLNIPPQEWVYSETQALMSVTAVFIWCRAPFMIIMFYTGLLAVSDDVLDAARIDGAGAWQQFWRIKLPLIKPLFFVAILFQTIEACKEFDLFFILTQGGPGTSSETMSVFAYVNSFTFLKMGYGSASALLIAAFTAIVAVLIIKIGGINLEN
jgi:multiple sugar transport system permease protein